MSNAAFVRLVPVLFVVLWSTGWISGRAIAPYAEPLSFLAVRFACTIVLLAAVVAWTNAAWPASRRLVWQSMVAGVLFNGIYLAAVWYAITHGLPASISGVIAAIQPIVTAMLAPSLLGERISGRQKAGIAVGFGGIALVLWPQLARVAAADLTAVSGLIAINIVGMLSVTAATFYQKRYLTGVDMRTGTLLQYIGALIFVTPLALTLETFRIEWNPTTIATLVWSVLALSVGAVMLYLAMIKRGEVSRTATYIYLVPAAVALEAMLLFGETLTLVQIVGMAATVAGVALAVRRG